MNGAIRKLTPTAELILVLLIGFWWDLIPTTLRILTGNFRALTDIAFSNRDVAPVVLAELLSLALICYIARVRGWSLLSFNIRPTWKGTGAGILVILASYLAVYVTYIPAYYLAPHLLRNDFAHGSVSLWVILLLCLVNPLYEEMLEIGYFYRAFQKRGLLIFTIASVVFRTYLHAYQGVYCLVTVAPLAIVFCLVYWKWRRLWPLVVAHALYDFSGLLFLRHTG